MRRKIIRKDRGGMENESNPEFSEGRGGFAQFPSETNPN